jgi:hypothetical protein
MTTDTPSPVSTGDLCFVVGYDGSIAVSLARHAPVPVVIVP